MQNGKEEEANGGQRGGVEGWCKRQGGVDEKGGEKQTIRTTEKIG